MLKFEGPYRVLEVQNNSLSIWKRGRRITVNVDQVRIYHPRNSETSSYDSINETTYEEKGSSNWSNRSNSEKSRRSRKPSGNEDKSCKLDKGNAGLEDLRVRRDRAAESTGTSERYDGKRAKIYRKRSFRGSLRYFQEHQIKDRRGGPIHLNKRAVEKQEWSLTESERPGQEPLQRTRKTTGGAEEYGDRQPTTEQPQEKELLCGSIRDGDPADRST
ncbi:uncharacterized protein TNCV_5083561 [Trichonephila clavipes]|nr:uncharacterized protein TNCV_5083561 [Trichonephila clavipes]